MIDAWLIVIRYLITYSSGILVAHGVLAVGITDDVATAAAQIVVGIITGGGMLLWGLYKSRRKAMMEKLMADPKVHAIGVTPELAQSVNIPGVVPMTNPGPA